jgi:predicted permease
MTGWVRRWRNRLRFRRFDEDIAEELAFHRTMKARELEARGLRAADLDRAVRRELGSTLAARDQARSVWVAPWLDGLRQDLRDALRSMARRRALAATAVGALAIGSAAATTGFMLVDALILRPLPVTHPDELVWLRAPAFSFPIVGEVRARGDMFAGAFGWGLRPMDVAWTGEPAPTTTLFVTGPYFSTLGVRPAAGRLLDERDDGATSDDAVAVLSHRAWQRRFGADPGIVGRTVRVDGMAVTIVGVAPEGFFGVAPGTAPELTLPLTLLARLRTDDRSSLTSRAWLHVMARLSPRLTREEADRRFQVVWSQVLETTTGLDEPPDRRARFLARRSGLEPGDAGYSDVRNQLRAPLWVLAALVALVALVACATAANVFLASALARSRELALRAALGCGRRRLVRQLLVEGFVLALVAAAAGLVVSRWSTDAIVGLLTTGDSIFLELAPDWRLLAFAASSVGVATMLFALAPALLTARVDPARALQAGARLTLHGRGRFTRALVVSQTAFSVILLVAAALFLRSLGHVLSLDPGFDPSRLRLVRLDPAALVRTSDPASKPALIESYHLQAVERLRTLPQVESASLSWYPLISIDAGHQTRTLAMDGGPFVEENTRTYFNGVSDGFFATAGMALLHGRAFTRDDQRESERVVVINRTLARAAFGGRSPLGHRITIGLHDSRRDLTIVGVVADAKYQRLQEPQRRIAYLPLAQLHEYQEGSPVVATVRLREDPGDADAAIRATLHAIDPRPAIVVEPMEDRLRESLVRERLLAMLALSLAGAALALSVGSLVGVMLHLVGQRTKEIGVRLTLGARPRALVADVLAQTIVLAAAGVIVGTAVALASGRLVAGLLHGVSPTDLTSLVTVIGIALVASVAAGVIPAVRAARVDPLQALRAE